jgi:biopolymer transport protein ExbD
MQASEIGSDAITGINVTPLVDVILVLLIIFMATAPLLERRAINVNIPRAARSERAATETLRIELTSDRKLRLEGRPLTEPDLVRELETAVARQPATHVALAADQGLPYGEIVALLDAVKGAGVKRVGLDVRPGKGPRTAPR